MDLESDLGVDSIKRVEILAAAVERRPGLPEMDTSRMAAMRSLREIVAYLLEENAGPVATIAEVPPEQPGFVWLDASAGSRSS